MEAQPHRELRSAVSTGHQILTSLIHLQIALTGLSGEEDMRKAGVAEQDGPIDGWIVKGGKSSMRAVMDEIAVVQGSRGQTRR